MKKKLLYFVLGFFLAWMISITQFWLPTSNTYLIATLALLPIGYMIGRREDSPLLTAVLWNIGGLIVHGGYFLSGQYYMWPFSFPLLSLSPTVACYLGIRLRKRDLPLPLGIGLTSLFVAHGLFFCFWLMPRHLFNYYDHPLHTPVSGITLTGLHGPDTQLPMAGKSVVVIDFWHTRCGACYDLKPEMQAMARQWQADTRVQFISVASAHFDSLAGVRASRYLRVGDTTALPEFFDGSGLLAKKVVPAGCPVVALVDGQGVARLLHRAYDRGTAGVYRQLMSAHIEDLLAKQM
jgi:thiol-disulfide isomerase/thioredoxin